MAAGKQRASLKEQEKQLIRAMTDYIDSPVLSTAREQLVACQMYGAEELARLHQVLLEKEAQLIHREELEQEINPPGRLSDRVGRASGGNERKHQADRGLSGYAGRTESAVGGQPSSGTISPFTGLLSGRRSGGN